MKQKRLSSLTALCLGFVLAAGCGEKPKYPPLGTVSGVVTLDDRPLEKATVLFQPPDGRPSMAKTDATGAYSLEYAQGVAGALVGPHTVIIRTEILGADGKPPVAPEILPEKYHAKTELTAEVKAGKNKIDFPLTSK